MAALQDTLTVTLTIDADDVEVINAKIKALERQLAEARRVAYELSCLREQELPGLIATFKLRHPWLKEYQPIPEEADASP